MADPDTPVRTDGLYRSIKQNGDPSWLRFYPHGRVLSVSTSPAPAAQIACWLRDRPDATLSSGDWVFDRDVLRFVTHSSHPGVVMVAPGHMQQTTIHYASTHEAEVFDGGARLVSRWSTSLSNPSEAPRHGESRYDFVPVDPRCLDGAGRAKDFRNVRAFTTLLRDGFDPAQVAAIKKLRGVKLSTLNCLERDELLALGVDPLFLDRFLPWREGR